MREYHSIHLVKGEDLNHHGTLFAARTASWFVESAFSAAAIEHGDPHEILCRNIHGMSFEIPVQNGEVVVFTSRVAFTGKTSLMVHVGVKLESSGETAVDGYLTFVTVDKATGKKRAHGIVLDEAQDEREREERAEAERIRSKLGGK